MQYQIEAAALYRNYPLDHERSQIRLLIVHPGEWEDDISCDFKIVSLDHHPTYAALSYAWGREEPDSLAKIGACLVPIRPSLFAALRRLRAHAAGKDETIWVDALCINQASIDERNSQVAMMGQIYSLCTSVSVWLGELEFAPEICPGSPIEANPGRCYTIDHGGECPSSREGIHAIMGNIPEWEGLLRIATYLSLMAARGSTSFITYLVEYSLAKHDLQERLFTKIIQGLESNEWFNRLWVVQEYILASAVTVYIGPVALPWTMFSRASEAYRNFLSWAYASAPETHDASCRILINTGIIRFVEFAKLRDSIRERPERQTILELRLQLSRRFASVDLDQIYSLYGVHGYIQDHDGEDAAREPEDSPNYNDPPEGTYVVTSLRHFKEARSLLPLSLSSYKQKYTSTPSWTIDWTALQSDQIGFDHRLWTEMYGMFHADHGLGEPQSCFTNHNTIMSLQGVLIDEVIVAARFDNEEERSAFMDTMRTRDPAGLYPGNEQMTWADAWFRTVVADSVRSFPSPSDGQNKVSLNRLEQTRYHEGILQRLPFILKSYSPWIPDAEGNPKDERREDSKAWGKYQWRTNNTPPASPTVKELEALARALKAQAKSILHGRTLFLTKNGYLGVTHKCKPSDQIYVFKCGKAPIILEELSNPLVDVAEQARERRKVDPEAKLRFDDGRQYRVVSDCYLQGCMDGEHNERLLDERGGLSVVSIV